MDVSVLIKYGYTILDVAKQVQNAVYNAIENTSGLNVESVNIHVAGVTFERDAKRPSSKYGAQPRTGRRKFARVFCLCGITSFLFMHTCCIM